MKKILNILFLMILAGATTSQTINVDTLLLIDSNLVAKGQLYYLAIDRATHTLYINSDTITGKGGIGDTSLWVRIGNSLHSKTWLHDSVGIGTEDPISRLGVHGDISQSSGNFIRNSGAKAIDGNGITITDQDGWGIKVADGGALYLYVLDEDVTASKVLVSDNFSKVGWVSKEDLAGGDTCLWQYVPDDTIKPKHDVVVDHLFKTTSSVDMNWGGYKFGSEANLFGYGIPYFGMRRSNDGGNYYNGIFDGSGIGSDTTLLFGWIRNDLSEGYALNIDSNAIQLGSNPSLTGSALIDIGDNLAKDDIININGTAYYNGVELNSGGAEGVTSIAEGNGLTFSVDPIVTTGTISMGTPSTVSGRSTNSTGVETHEHDVETSVWIVNGSDTIPDGDAVYDYINSLGVSNYWTYVDSATDTTYNNKSGVLYFKTDVVTDRWLKSATNTSFGIMASWKGYQHSTGNQGYFNTAIGNESLQEITTGAWNTAIGASAGHNNTSGECNTYVGHSAGGTNSTGDYNTFIGRYAGASNNSSHNVGIGSQAMMYNTGQNNTIIGAGTMGAVGNGQGNTVLGEGGLAWGSSASYNVSIGHNSLLQNSTGNLNVALGYEAGYSEVSGASNVFIGAYAGFYETGSNKLYIDNSNTSTPLIGGDFSVNRVTINTFLNLAPSASPPASPVEGDVYYDSGTDRVQVFTTAGWKSIKWTDD